MTLLEMLKNVKNLPALSIYKTDTMRLSAMQANIKLILKFLDKGYSFEDKTTNITDILKISRTEGEIPSEEEYRKYLRGIRKSDLVKFYRDLMVKHPLGCILPTYMSEQMLCSRLGTFVDLYLEDKDEKANLIVPTYDIKVEMHKYIHKNKKEFLNSKKIKNIIVVDNSYNLYATNPDTRLKNYILEGPDMPNTRAKPLPHCSIHSYVFAIHLGTVPKSQFKVNLVYPEQPEENFWKPPNMGKILRIPPKFINVNILKGEE